MTEKRRQTGTILFRLMPDEEALLAQAATLVNLTPPRYAKTAALRDAARRVHAQKLDRLGDVLYAVFGDDPRVAAVLAVLNLDAPLPNPDPNDEAGAPP